MAEIGKRRAHRSRAWRPGGFLAIGLFVALSVTTSGARGGSSRASAVQQPGPGDLASVLGLPHRPAPGEVSPAIRPQQLALAPGIPVNMNAGSALSTAVITNLAGQAVNLLGDWDGQEDLVADHAGRVASMLTPGAVLTRAAISEHTIANGFPEDIFYYGDSIGNVYVAATTASPGLTSPAPAPSLTTINLPTVLNAFGTLTSDSQIVVTGLAVSPVVDLSSFANVNGAFAPYNGLIGEILYVTYTDTGSGFRLVSTSQLTRSGLLAFPIADIVSPAAAPPGIISAAGYPVQIGGSFGVAFSAFSNLAGVAVDDDGSVYFQQVDLLQFTGANIVKVAPTGTNQNRSLATSGFLPAMTTLNPANGNYGSSSGPASQVDTATNYSGTSSTWGNITALATGPGNVLYAAVARSFVATDDAATQNTEGLFTNPVALGATPSMIISFADCSGAFDGCTTLLPVGEGKAEAAASDLTLSAGVNNFRVFVMGDGPDRRGASASSSPVLGTVDDTLKLSFQIDYTIYSGLTVDEENSVYVVSGGTPAGVGRNPSPNLGEILLFPDSAPADRRADYIDLRADVVPSLPTAATAGDSDSDRYDHIFWQAPLDVTTITPEGISGLARGFLLYLNRTRTADATPGLPNGTTQTDDSTSGPITFGSLDPGHQVGGGDDQTFPFTGDDSDGGGSPTIGTAQEGGFEFTFNNGGTQTSWNAFFLNSNGSVSFGAGDSNNTPSVASFLGGVPRIAPAYTDVNPGGRIISTVSFPVQAVGFAGVNDFKIRWINVPTFGSESCTCRNTFSVSLFDDGTGLDENASQPFNSANPIGNNAVPFDQKEGPTALRWLVNGSAQLVGRTARPAGSGYFTFTYGRMDLIGTSGQPVLVGFSAGSLSVGGPNQQVLNFSSQATRIGDGSQPAIYEFFNTGTPSAPAFDLRFDGNSPALCTPAGQADANRGLLQFTGFTFQGHVPFVNEPLVPGVSLIKAGDITELRNRINTLRARVPALGSFVYTDAVISAGSTPIMTRVVNELRTAITDVYVAYGLPAPAFAETLVAGTTPIRASHIIELRNAVGALE